MQNVATVIVPLIAAFAGSWFGARVALLRFKKERAFERRLDWYERVIRALHKMAQKIEIAATFEEERGPKDPTTGCWRGVQLQHEHLILESVVVEAELYGSSEAVKVTSEIFTEKGKARPAERRRRRAKRVQANAQLIRQ